MEISESYQTLEGESEGFYKEKGSKFIGIAVPCFDEEQAKSFLEEWKKQHHSARHLCYAYRFGVEKTNYRANDDGEPNNSAGAPILGQIQSFDLTNVLVGVVRYYGGTKLGVGGLINAYRTAAKEAIEAGKICTRTLHRFIELRFNYAQMPDVMNEVKMQAIEIVQQEFEIDCYLKIAVPLSSEELIMERLQRIHELKIKQLEVK